MCVEGESDDGILIFCRWWEIFIYACVGCCYSCNTYVDYSSFGGISWISSVPYVICQWTDSFCLSRVFCVCVRVCVFWVSITQIGLSFVSYWLGFTSSFTSKFRVGNAAVSLAPHFTSREGPSFRRSPTISAFATQSTRQLNFKAQKRCNWWASSTIWPLAQAVSLNSSRTWSNPLR